MFQRAYELGRMGLPTRDLLPLEWIAAGRERAASRGNRQAGSLTDVTRLTSWTQRIAIGSVFRLVAGKLLATDALLTPRRVRHYPLLALAITVFGYTIAIAAGHPPFDAFGQAIAVDFSAHVTGGRMALDGNLRHLYDIAQQRAVQGQVLGSAPDDSIDLYLSPPFVAYLYAPFAALPYLVGAATWTALSVALLALSVYLLWPVVPRLHRHGFGLVLLLAFATPPALDLLGSEQDTAISLFLLAAGLRLLLADRELAAGAVLGLGLFKPQLFILMPVLLVAQRRWRALASWSAVALVLTGASLALVGPDGARAYVRLLTSDVYRQGIAADLSWKMLSLPAFVRSLFQGFALPAPALNLLSAMALGAGGVLLGAIARLPRREPDQRGLALLYALAVLITAAASPHFFLYDATLLLLPALILLDAFPASAAIRVSLAAGYVLTWITPLVHLLFGNAPWPLAVLAAPWAVLPLLVLLWTAAGAVVDRHPAQRAPAISALPGD